MTDDEMERFEEKYIPEPNSGCWLWMAAHNGKNYGRFCVNGEDYYTHRLSWMLHKGPIPDGLCVLHKCDTPCCVNPAHLFLGTKGDNNQDMAKKGRHVGNARLTVEQVREIRELLKTDMSQSEIANVFGVIRGTIHHIKTGRTWGRIDG